MIRDEITELAEKNKWRTATTILVLAILDDAVREEREACAKVVENYTGAWSDEGYALSQAIRARGEK